MEKNYSPPRQNSSEAGTGVSNPEQALILDAKEQQSLRGLYDLDSIEEFRQIQDKIGANVVSSDVPDFMKSVLEAETGAADTRKHNIDTYLGLYGIDETSASYERAHNDVDTFLSIPEDEWFVARPERDGEDDLATAYSGRDVVRRSYADLTGVDYYSSEEASRGEDESGPAPGGDVVESDTAEEDLVSESPEADDDTVIIETLTPAEAAGEELSLTRAKLAKLNAKRQGRLWTGARAKAEYAELQAEYNKQLQELGKLELADKLEDESLSELDKNKEVIAFLFDEQAKLRKESKEAFDGTLVSKAIERLNSGTKLQRLGKAALLGAGITVAGFGIGAVAGAAGAAAVGVGVAAAVTGAGRYLRGYARNDAKRGRGIQAINRKDHTDLALDHLSGEDERVKKQAEEVEQRQKAEDEQAALLGLEPVERSTDAAPDAAPRDVFTIIQEHFDEKLEADTKLEQKKRRNSTYIALGGVAAGAVAGAVFHAADLFDTVATTPVETPSVAPQGGSGTPLESPFFDPSELGNDVASEDMSDDLVDRMDQFTSTDGDYIDTTVGPTTPEEITFDPRFNVEYGVGGIGLFEAAGLTEADWYSIAPELAANFPAEFYSDGVDVRIMNGGSLSLDAQNFIKARFGL